MKLNPLDLLRAENAQLRRNLQQACERLSSLTDESRQLGQFVCSLLHSTGGAHTMTFASMAETRRESLYRFKAEAFDEGVVLTLYKATPDEQEQLAQQDAKEMAEGEPQAPGRPEADVSQARIELP